MCSGEDLTELCAHVLPEVWGLFRGCWPAGLRLRHPGQALAPEGVLGQAVLEELEQREADHRHDPDGQVNGFRLGLGDMPPARRNIQSIPRLQPTRQAYRGRLAVIAQVRRHVVPHRPGVQRVLPNRVLLAAVDLNDEDLLQIIMPPEGLALVRRQVALDIGGGVE
jgi:hypothetical protein